MSNLASNLNDLVDICYSASREAGWWHDLKTGEHARDKRETFAVKLMLTVSELSEAMEADRKGLMDDKLSHRDGREVELADAIIRICDLAGAYGMDLGGAVAEKMEFNASRSDHKISNRQAAGGKSY